MKRLVTVLVLALASSATTARADDAEKDKPGASSTADTSKPVTPSADAQEPHYPPPSTRLKLIGAGLFVTAAAWGVSFAASRLWPVQPCIITDAGPVYPNTNNVPCSSGPPGAAQLGIPIVGPWLALGVSGCAVDEPTCSVAKPIFRGIGYVLNGVAQLGGLALVAEALIMKTESTVDPAKKTSPLALRAGIFELKPLPIVTPSMSGLSLTGTF